MKIALVTYLDKGAYNATNVAQEDDILLQLLTANGLNIEKVIWNDPAVNWDNYQLAILKSPWDYFDLIDDFYRWLKLIENKKIRLLNPISIVRWNADKHYLKDIADAGLKVTPSLYLEKGSLADIDYFFNQFNTDTIIFKPCVSGGAKNTFKITKAEAINYLPKLNLLLKQEAFIAQPFLKSIEQHGEWSFIFFNGKYSHALIKKAKHGDFRVQQIFGGSIETQQPNDATLAQAEKYVTQFAKDCLYARVDGVMVNGDFTLMELELIEPFLFLNAAKGAYQNYYEGLKALI